MFGAGISVGTSGIGPQGAIGSQGASSAAGAQGNQGFQGIQGAGGAQGSQGSQGAQGSSSGPPVAGYVAWYDASDTSSITSSGGAVSQWNDKSGNGYHLTQSTEANKPTTGTDSINGKNVMNFAAGGRYINRASTPSQNTWTWFFVMKAASVANWQFPVGSNDPGNAGLSCYSSGSGSTLRALFGGSPLATSSSTTVGTYYWTVTGDTSNCYIYRNGIADGNGLTYGSSTWSGFCLGGLGAIYTLNGAIGEFIVYNSVLGTTDRQTVESYLATKWGL